MNKLNLKDNQKIVILGLGSVGKCIIHYIDTFFNIKFDNIYLVDKHIIVYPTIQNAIDKKASFINYEITDSNSINHLFDSLIKLQKNDIVIDVTTNTDTLEIYKYTNNNSIHYINTSIEDYNKQYNDFMDKTIFFQHDKLKKLEKKSNISSLIEFGMNPGLISIFTKHGIKKLTKEVLDYQTRTGS